MKYGFYSILLILILIGVLMLFDMPGERCVQLAMSGEIQKAVEPCKVAADQGQPEAQYLLGVMYSRGEGVSVDELQAVKWYRKAAEQGYLAAQYNLGHAYQTGKGITRDTREAFKWYLMAGERGYADAQYSIGRMYLTGEGVPQNSVVAYAWFDTSASQGYELAIKSRDTLLERLIPEHLEQAQELSREYHRKYALISED